MTESLDPEIQAALGTALRVLLRTGRETHTAMAHHLGLGETDLAAMDELVSSQAPLGPVELGYRLGIRSASSTVLVDRLQAAGHLRREPHPSDRRRVVLRASESARAEVRATLTPLLVAIGDITARFDTTQATVVLSFLRDVTAAMAEFAGSTAEPRAKSPRGTDVSMPRVLNVGRPNPAGQDIPASGCKSRASAGSASRRRRVVVLEGTALPHERRTSSP